METFAEELTARDILKSIDGSWEPVEGEEKPKSKVDFKVPIKGKYRAVVREFTEGGNATYPNFKLSLGITSDLLGDESGKRNIDITYWINDKDGNPQESFAINKALTDFDLAGIVKATDRVTMAGKAGLLQLAEQLIGRSLEISAWEYNGKQYCKVCKSTVKDELADF